MGPKGDKGNPGDPATVPSNLRVNSLDIGSLQLRDEGGGLRVRFPEGGALSLMSASSTGNPNDPNPWIYRQGRGGQNASANFSGW
jgi:hypothetical protein